MSDVTPQQLAERWAAVPDYPDYEVSDRGVVRNIRSQKTLKPRLLKGPRNKDGYVRVALHNGGPSTRKDIFVHRLVLTAFVGPPPPGTISAHLDGNSLHNSLANLAWVSQKENCRQRLAHGTAPRGTKHPESKFTEAQLAEVRRLAGTMRNVDLGKLFGVSGNVIYCIRTGRTYK
jgi:hypothetical protein